MCLRVKPDSREKKRVDAIETAKYAPGENVTFTQGTGENEGKILINAEGGGAGGGGIKISNAYAGESTSTEENKSYYTRYKTRTLYKKAGGLSLAMVKMQSGVMSRFLLGAYQKISLDIIFGTGSLLNYPTEYNTNSYQSNGYVEQFAAAANPSNMNSDCVFFYGYDIRTNPQNSSLLDVRFYLSSPVSYPREFEKLEIWPIYA